MGQSVKKESVMQITAAVKHADRDTFSIERLELEPPRPKTDWVSPRLDHQAVSRVPITATVIAHGLYYSCANSLEQL